MREEPKTRPKFVTFAEADKLTTERYYVNTKCTNCGAKRGMSLGKKLLVSEYPCEHCGCHKLVLCNTE